MTTAGELFEVVCAFEKMAENATDPKITQPIQRRIDACQEVAKAFSNSWLGYHSRVYQEGLVARPGARFDMQWGLSELRFGDSRGQWAEYDPEAIKAKIVKMSGNHDFSAIEKAAGEVARDFDRAKADVLSIFSSDLENRSDGFLAKLKDDLEKVDSLSCREAVLVYRPSGQFRSADTIAITAGLVTPPHVEMLAEMVSLTTIFNAPQQAAELVRKAASHVERRTKGAAKKERIGTNVFLGHGRSLLWRELKDFVADRLHLPVDEFNRVPVAGVTNIARLSEMLDAAAVAFVIMIAEDETSEGKLQARMNVIHEVGLFQGRLGFTRGIVMLEEGCEEFSNVQGTWANSLSEGADQCGLRGRSPCS